MSAMEKSAETSHTGGREAQTTGKTGRRASVLVLMLTMLGVGVRVHRFGTSGFPSISETMVILAALFIVMHALLHPRCSIVRIDSSIKWLGAFLLWASVSYFWALHPEVVAGEVTAIALKAITYGLIISCTLRREHLDHWGLLFIFMSIGFAITAFLEGQGVGKAGFQEAAEAAGGWTWINQLGKWSCLLLPFNVHYVAFGHTRLRKTLAALGIVGNLVTVYLIIRRAPLLIITVELVLFALIFRRYRATFIGIALLMLLALPLIVIRNPQYAERVALTVFEVSARIRGEEFAYGNVRFMQYQAGAAAVREHYLVGLGIGSLRYWTHEVYGFRMVFWPHNLTLQLLGELGIPGAFLFAGFIVSSIRRGWRTWKLLMKRGAFDEASLVTAMIVSVIGMVIYGQFQPILTEMHLYLAVSLLSVAATVYRTPPPEDAGTEEAVTEQASSA